MIVQTSFAPSVKPAAATVTVTKRAVSREEWDKKLTEVKLNKTDLNHLVMNFLVIEGYKDAAEKFQQESGTPPGLDLSSISDRMAIRSAIQKGNIQEAIERVNDLDPSILDTNPRLIFHLRQQQLIELIRQGQLEAAIKFAQEELALRGEGNTEFLEELEKTMGLLAFENPMAAGGSVAALADPAQRLRLASELNTAILTAQFREREPKLPTLLKMLLWSQQQLDERLSFPKISLAGQFSSPSVVATSSATTSSTAASSTTSTTTSTSTSTATATATATAPATSASTSTSASASTSTAVSQSGV